MPKPPAVAGSFYPEDPQRLSSLLSALFASSTRQQTNRSYAIIPHAGYMFSGPIAANAWASLSSQRPPGITIIGPCHRMALHGCAVPSHEAFATPLGQVPVDQASCQTLLSIPQVHQNDAAHAREHSIEVQLPFIQHCWSSPPPIIPVVVGQADVNTVSAIIEACWGKLIIISSDLSHFLPAEEAETLDRRCIAAIEALDTAAIKPHQACGATAIAALVNVVSTKGYGLRCIDYRHSGDTAGSREQVVGYASLLGC